MRRTHSFGTSIINRLVVLSAIEFFEGICRVAVHVRTEVRKESLWSEIKPAINPPVEDK